MFMVCPVQCTVCINVSKDEVKWKKERVKIPQDWTSGYPDAAFEVIHCENYLKFIQ